MIQMGKRREVWLCMPLFVRFVLLVLLCVCSVVLGGCISSRITLFDGDPYTPNDVKEMLDFINLFYKKLVMFVFCSNNSFLPCFLFIYPADRRFQYFPSQGTCPRTALSSPDNLSPAALQDLLLSWSVYRKYRPSAAHYSG